MRTWSQHISSASNLEVWWASIVAPHQADERPDIQRCTRPVPPTVDGAHASVAFASPPPVNRSF